jgi:parvulin-like peptidyl-prolyl isomerase
VTLCTLLLSLACEGPATSDGTPATELVPSAPIQASALPIAKRAKARHVLVAHKDALRSPEHLRRTREEAKERASKVLAEARAGEDFGRLASEYSDGPSSKRGGELGVFGIGTMAKPFEEAVFGMQVGALGLVETDFGFHIVERMPLEEVRIVHIIVQWEGGQRSEAVRSKDEALETATMVYQLLGEGMPAADAAIRYSDGPFGSRGGDVGWFERGQLNPAIEQVAFALGTEEYSGLVETPVGYHLLYRLE